MNWLSPLASVRPFPTQRSRRRPSRGQHGYAPAQSRQVRPLVEPLEDRFLPSVTVTTALDATITNRLSLRQAITMVNNGQVADNTIILPAGNYLNLNKALNVTHSLILQGAGASTTIVDGGGADRVFFIAPAAAITVQFSSVTIRDGVTAGNGGGIDVEDASGQSSTLTLTRCIVTGNTAAVGNTTTNGFFGGGVAVINGDVTLINSQVTDNQVMGVDGFGGGIADATLGTGNITVTDSDVSLNTAGSAGGGITLLGDAMHGGQGSLTITGSTISNNALTSATLGGGGVFVATVGAVSVSTSTISDNTSLLDGGGFENDSIRPASLVFTGDTLTGNRSTQGNGGGIGLSQSNANLTVQGSTIAGNSAAQSGGGISDPGNGVVTLTGDRILDNTAASSLGGGISYAGTSRVAITDCTVSGNVATLSKGGGLALPNAAATATIADSTLTGNKAATSGGGVYDDAAALTVTDSNIDNNTAHDGGGIESESGANQTVALTGVTLSNNTALAFGGGLGVFSSMISTTLMNCLVLDNTSGGTAGGIYQAAGTLALSNSQFTGNVTEGNGGAIDLNGMMILTVSASTFNSNQAVGNGGAIELGTSTTTATFTNGTFTGNTAVMNGGALDGSLSPASGQAAYLVNDTINGNSAGTTGGGDNLTGSVMLVNVILAQNTASGVSSGTNPGLGALQDNGGPFAGARNTGQVVQTEALLPGSSAIGTGVATGAPNSDERGYPRPGGGSANPSPGAYEPQYSASASANQAFVENVYEVLLNRPAAPGEVAGWTALLSQGTTPSGVVAAIAASTEYRNDEVQALYLRYLHRPADSGGLQSWVNALAGGSTLEQVAAALVSSAEYFQLHGGSNLGFLAALYEDALGRQADPQGQNNFLQELASGTSRASVAAAVFGSNEYQTDLVEADFLSLLGRQADPGGLASFVQELASGTTDQGVVAAILGSGEAFAKRT